MKHQLTTCLCGLLTCALALPSVCAAAADSADGTTRLNGRRVRLYGPGIAEGTLIGTVVETEGDALVLAPEGGHPARRVTLDQNVRVQVSSTTLSRVERGLLEGAAIGGVSYGLPAAALRGASGGCGGGPKCAALLAKTTAVGALVGAAVGVTLHVVGDSWQPAEPAPCVSLAVAPARGHGWRALVALRF